MKTTWMVVLVTPYEYRKAIAGIEAATDSPTRVDLQDFKSRP